MKLSKTIGLFLLVLGVTASAQEKRASPAAQAKGTINGANITINYSSPSVKGREIWGALVPFNEVWRAGANEATTFTTDKDLTVEGQKLPAGTYSLFVIPTKSDATIIFNKTATQWGAYKYEAKDDQLRVKVKPVANAASTERLVYEIGNGKVTLTWEKWSIPVSVK